MSSYPHVSGVYFSFCNTSGKVELALSRQVSLCVLARKNIFNETPGSVSIEPRFYFNDYPLAKRGFISARIGTSNNVGIAFGFQQNNVMDGSTMEMHVGSYSNLNSWMIKPTFGISFGTNEYS